MGKMKYKSGDTLNGFKLIEFIGGKNSNWKYRCPICNEVKDDKNIARLSKIKSCGCNITECRRKTYKIGDMIGIFEVISNEFFYKYYGTRKRTMVKVKCPICDKEFIELPSVLRRNKSCGCKQDIGKFNREKSLLQIGEYINDFKIIDILTDNRGRTTYKCICPICNKEFIDTKGNIKRRNSCGCIHFEVNRKYKVGDIINDFEILEMTDTIVHNERIYRVKCPICKREDYYTQLNKLNVQKSCGCDRYKAKTKYKIGDILCGFELVDIDLSYPSHDKHRYTWKCPKCSNVMNAIPNSLKRQKSCGCLPTKGNYKNKIFKGYLFLRYEYTGRNGNEYFLARSIETNEELVLSPENLI